MADITLIASYPRSGNSWVRFLLANAIYGEIRSSQQLAGLVPDIHQSISAIHLGKNRRTLIKVHWAWHPRLALREDTRAAIYLMRHPIDVMASACAHHFGAAIPPEDEMDRWVDAYIENGGQTNWCRSDFGSWEENVASWTTGNVPYPTLVVRYEDLCMDPVAELARMATFMKLPCGPSDIDRAVACASRSRLKAMEDREIADRTPGLFFNPAFADAYRRGFRFIGGTESPAGKTLLDDLHRKRATMCFQQVMDRFGYSGMSARS